MNDDQLVADFYELFQGNTDAHGTNEGGAKHLDMGDRDTWLELITDHLNGTEPIGIYPCSLRETEAGASGVTMVKWGCVDFDEGYQNSWPDALNLHNALEAFGVTSWIERSRSKGWHVWVFCDVWVTASVMRDALWAACEMVDAPTREVNPKQTDVSDGKLGNYVRLPYPGWTGEYGAESDAQKMVLPDQHEIEMFMCEFFVSEALANRCTLGELETLAAKRQRHDRTTTNTQMVQPQHVEPSLLRKMDGLAWTIYSQGPAGSTAGDRSATLWKLITRIWDSGRLTRDEAWSVVCAADQVWGKHHAKGDVDTLWNTFNKGFQPQPGGPT